jgi:hypothetical protein
MTRVSREAKEQKHKWQKFVSCELAHSLPSTLKPSIFNIKPYRIGFVERRVKPKLRFEKLYSFLPLNDYILSPSKKHPCF